MSELALEQYAAIGKLTLSFNHLEVAFELYTGYILRTPEFQIGAALASEGMFRQKADRFSKLLTLIAECHPVLLQRTKGINELIKQAKRLAEERNRYVHSFLVHDTITNTPQLKKGADHVPCDFNKIINMAGNADVLAVSVHFQCGGLLSELESERNKKLPAPAI
jgi:hypothetical protein